MRKYIPLLKQVIFFGVVGVTSLGIDVIVSTALYSNFNLPAYLASAAGFLSGFLFNFPMNRKRVFRHSENDRFTLQIQAVYFTILCIFNLAFTSILVDVLVNYDILEIQYAKVIATILIAVWNFVIFKLFIFSKKHSI